MSINLVLFIVSYRIIAHVYTLFIIGTICSRGNWVQWSTSNIKPLPRCFLHDIFKAKFTVNKILQNNTELQKLLKNNTEFLTVPTISLLILSQLVKQNKYWGVTLRKSMKRKVEVNWLFDIFLRPSQRSWGCVVQREAKHASRLF